MLLFDPRTDEPAQALWCLYAASEASDEATGVDSDVGEWLAASGPLTAAETAAIRTLRGRVRGPGRRALVGATARGVPAAEPDSVAALGALTRRAGDVYGAAAPILARWSERLHEPAPAWVEPMRAAANVFFG